MRLRCPGLSGQRLTSTVVPCPECGGEVEIFSDESKVPCPRCKAPVYKKAVPTCARWCKAAAECMGIRAQNVQDDAAAEVTAFRGTPSDS